MGLNGRHLILKNPLAIVKMPEQVYACGKNLEEGEA